MNTQTALQRLYKFDAKGIYVYTKRDLRRVFFDDADETFKKGLSRLVKSGILESACKGIYVFAYSKNKGANTIELVAGALRRGEYNYISLESALSEYGLISQIPISTLTVMTTGRSGRFKTLYGIIEFTKTKRDALDILNSTNKTDRHLRFAKKEAALRDLKRVGRNTHMLVDAEDE
ncbi:type IV toxin-antitoxin system AbiEi family antitoxin [Vibrio antiquarius]|uniref:Transcriptional regulator, AbiEi antitoxin, Type IV TA system n=3 Tax=Vibrio TaxID=662 RepID=A0A0L7Z181_VIBPH|nr:MULTISPECIES: hypothetical protein [Vibrio]AKO78006.1 hypothetical protein EN12_23185 [Vibrio cholerae]EJG0766659.1 hypothetical protein [Vibrio parahaemolyticus O5:K30]EQM48596.1 hypothetical protein D051_0824 [Vibrio parahaemolyticus VPCR-2010]MCA2474684.1 hypothetical protein [Vibrio alginolyticus]ARN69216.1 hypothetical protein FORC36_4699 [Vibrio vulnificus]